MILLKRKWQLYTAFSFLTYHIKFKMNRKRSYTMQETLRKRVKVLKAIQNISYTELADYLEIHRNSFYNWLNGYYNLSRETEMKLIEIINTLQE